MRLNTLFKILGLTAVLALPLTLVGCDDDPSDPSTDAAVDGSTTDTSVTDTLIKTDAAPKLDASSDAATDTHTGDAGDASTNG